MARLRPSWYVGTTLTLLSAGTGCSNPLEPADLAGTYRATTFTVELPGAGRLDALSLGASITLELRADGTTTGRLVLPPIPGFSTEPADEDLSGTFSVTSAGRVKLSPAQTTFIQDFLFQPDGRELRAGYVFQDSQARQGNVQLTLTRQ